MVQYSGYVATPANSAHGASWKPRLEVRLLEAAHYGGTLVNTDPQYFDLPSSGAYTVDLIPSDQMRSRSGRSALYQVSETWLDQAGRVQRYSDWGTFYLTSAGGTLSDHSVLPAGVKAVYIVETEEEIPEKLDTGDVVIVTSTGEIKQEVA